MARKARLFVPGALYHMYCRTARGERTFSIEAEAEALVEAIRAVRDLDGVSELAWCVMGDHYHAEAVTRLQIVRRTPRILEPT